MICIVAGIVPLPPPSIMFTFRFTLTFTFCLSKSMNVSAPRGGQGAALRALRQKPLSLPKAQALLESLRSRDAP
jgi:hypothetical protein